MAAAIIANSFLLLKPITPTTQSHSSSPNPTLPIRRRSPAATMSSDLHSKGRSSRFLKFPYVSTPVKNLMVDLVSLVENQFGSHLMPCTLPEDVQFFENESGSSKASLHIRSASPSSKLDFMLGSWLHCALPTGGKLNIASLSAYLNSTTDAPNFLIEVIQSSPTSMVLLLDLPPRKDLVLHPEYLKTFYEDTKLDVQRQVLSTLPEVTPYVSSSLYIRSVFSPTAIFVNVESGAERMEEIVGEHVHPVAIEVMRVWLEVCSLEGRGVGEEERLVLERRDRLVRNKSIEIDLGSSLPRLFGQEVANKVLDAIRDVFNGKHQPTF